MHIKLFPWIEELLIVVSILKFQIGIIIFVYSKSILNINFSLYNN